MGVFWLNAKSIASIEQDLAGIGQVCGVPEPNVASVKSWIACNSYRWLLIIDNADDPLIDLSQYIPSGRRGDILITTRNLECGQYGTVGNETLPNLDLEFAQELLLRAANVPEHDWKEKEEATIAIVNALESHTLAIIQAGAYVRRRLCTLEEYPIIFQDQKDQILRFHSTQNMSTYGNVFSTFEVSAKYLEASPKPEDSDALHLLHTCAFMHNSGISERFYRRASLYASRLRERAASNDENAPSVNVQHFPGMPVYVGEDWSGPQGRMRWRQACSSLESLSIITVAEKNDSLTISAHSLVHAWALERQDHQLRCKAWRSAATVLALSYRPPRYDYKYMFLVQPHVRACVAHDIEEYTQHMSGKEIAHIFIQLLAVFNSNANYSALDSLHQRICRRLDHRRLDQDGLLQLKYFTARIAWSKRNFQEAVDSFRELFAIRSREWAEDDNRLQDIQMHLAYIYVDSGQIDKALELLEHFLRMTENLEEDDARRLNAQAALANFYMANQRSDEAVKMLEHAVKIQERLDESDSNKLASQHELGHAYLKNKQYEEAMKMLEHVVKIRERLDESDSNKLASQHELGHAYLKNKQYEEAMKMLEHVVKIRERLDESDSNRLASRHELGRAYLKNEQYEEAVKMLEHVVKIRERLDESESNRLASEHVLAHAYEEKGQLQQARKLLEHVVKIKSQKLGADDPSRILSRRALARVKRLCKENPESLESSP